MVSAVTVQSLGSCLTFSTTQAVSSQFLGLYERWRQLVCLEVVSAVMEATPVSVCVIVVVTPGMGSYCRSGGSCFTCCAEIDPPENNFYCFQASTGHITRDGSAVDGADLWCGLVLSFWWFLLHLVVQRWLSRVLGHCIQAATWHPARYFHCFCRDALL